MQPTSIERKENYIHINWQDGHQSVFETSYLRRRCPCVMCRNAKERTPDGGLQLLPSKTALEIVSAQQVGNYALNLRFNDGHDTGIYSFDHLRKICPCPSCRSTLGL